MTKKTYDEARVAKVRSRAADILRPKEKTALEKKYEALDAWKKWKGELKNGSSQRNGKRSGMFKTMLNALIGRGR